MSSDSASDNKQGSTPNASVGLPPLRRARKYDIPKLLGRVFESIRAVDAQVEPYALLWDEWNATQLDQDGPLWVVYGDSSSQGIGASDWAHGWVPLIFPRLREVTGEPWRVINLSMSGGRIRDVIDTQTPVASEYLPDPELVTCIIGSNDLFWRPREIDAIVAEALELGTVLPAGTLLSQTGGPTERHRRLKAAIDETAAANDLDLFNVWAWPSGRPAGREALAQDRVHPSDLGYHYMAELAWKAIGDKLGFSDPLTPALSS